MKFIVEAMHLAKDFNTVCENEFPARSIAEYLNQIKFSLEPSAAQRRKNMVLATRNMLTELKDLLTKDRSPLCSSCPPPILDIAIQAKLTHFSMVNFFFYFLILNKSTYFQVMVAVTALSWVKVT